MSSDEIQNEVVAAKPIKRRKRKAKAVEAAPVVSKDLDAEEKPESRHRRKLAEERELRMANVKAVESWFVHTPTKIIRKVKLSNGNVQSLFVCVVNKKNEMLIADLKKKNEFRAE